MITPLGNSPAAPNTLTWLSKALDGSIQYGVRRESPTGSVMTGGGGLGRDLPAVLAQIRAEIACGDLVLGTGAEFRDYSRGVAEMVATPLPFLLDSPPLPTLASLTAAADDRWTEGVTAALAEAEAIIRTLQDGQLAAAVSDFQAERAAARKAGDLTRRNMAIRLGDYARAEANRRAGGRDCSPYCSGIVPPEDVRHGITRCASCRDSDEAEADHERMLISRGIG